MTGVTFQVNNKDGIEILNDVDPTLHVVYKGDHTDINIPKLWPAWPEAPTVFIRPRPGSWCGGFCSFQRANGYLQIYCGGEFDYVICCSPTSWYPGGVRTFGLETFKEDGSLLFSTNNRFARVTTITTIIGPYTTTSGVRIVTTAPLVGWTEMPWINVSQAGLTGAIAMEDLAYQLSYLISINASFTQLSMDTSDNIPGPANYLANKPVYFPMGFIAGN